MHHISRDLTEVMVTLVLKSLEVRLAFMRQNNEAINGIPNPYLHAECRMHNYGPTTTFNSHHDKKRKKRQMYASGAIAIVSCLITRWQYYQMCDHLQQNH